MAMIKRMLHSIFRMQTFVNENPQKKNKENVQTCNQLFRSSAVGNSASSMSYYSSFFRFDFAHNSTAEVKKRTRDREAERGDLTIFFYWLRIAIRNETYYTQRMGHIWHRTVQNTFPSSFIVIFIVSSTMLSTVVLLYLRLCSRCCRLLLYILFICLKKTTDYTRLDGFGVTNQLLCVCVQWTNSFRFKFLSKKQRKRKNHFYIRRYLDSRPRLTMSIVLLWLSHTWDSIHSEMKWLVDTYINQTRSIWADQKRGGKREIEGEKRTDAPQLKTILFLDRVCAFFAVWSEDARKHFTFILLGVNNNGGGQRQ